MTSMTEASISRLLHEQSGISPGPEQQLAVGDVVRAVGTTESLDRLEVLLGEPTDREIPLSSRYEIDWIVVTKEEVIGRRLGELNLSDNYHATVVRVRRAGVDLLPRPNTMIRFGDRLKVAVDSSNMDSLSRALGNSSKRLKQADMLPIALGVVVGILLGRLAVPLPGGASFSLGLTGGVLISALVLSWIGKTGPIIWNISSEANAMLRLLGLVLFLAPVGLNAGARLAPTIAENGFGLFGVGALITVLPMLIAVAFSRLFFKANFLSVLGALTGGMTSTPGLSATDSLTETDAPQLGYATVYPFALVSIVLATQVLASFA